MPQTGLVQVYTGDGKGKTTAALGLAMRAVGRGLRVRFYQFMKPPESSGEHFSASRLPNLEIIPLGRPNWVFPATGPDSEDISMAAAGLARAREDLVSGDFDLIILDEVLVAVLLRLLELPALMDLLDARPPHVELVLTGRGAPREILDRADLVSSMTPVKHPFDAGIPAREGIEN